MLTEVCVCVCVCPLSTLGCVLMMASGEGADDEVCGGGCVFTIHYLRGGIAPDKGCFMPLQRCKPNTSRPCKHRREAMRAPFSLCVSSSVSAPPFRPFFSLLLTFVSHSSTFVALKRAINQAAHESHELRVPGLYWFKRTCFY